MPKAPNTQGVRSRVIPQKQLFIGLSGQGNDLLPSNSLNSTAATNGQVKLQTLKNTAVNQRGLSGLGISSTMPYKQNSLGSAVPTSQVLPRQFN